jgi:cobalt/nickel transport system permease protein
VLIVLIFPLSASVFIPFFNDGNVIYRINLYFFNLFITDNGIDIFFTTIFKSILSVLLLAALVVSSSDLELLSGLRKIHVPKIIVSIIFLMYRYFFLIRDEAKAGQLAIKSRVFEKKSRGFNKRLSYLSGALFIKSMDRAENIYKSMESRGFNGEFQYFNQENRKDSNLVLFIIFCICLVLVKCVELLYFRT